MRILAFFFMLITLLYLPFWAGLLMVASFALVFNYYYEAVFLGFLADRLYAPEAFLQNGFGMEYLIIFTLIVIIAEFLKTKLKYYPESI